MLVSGGGGGRLALAPQAGNDENMPNVGAHLSSAMKPSGGGGGSLSTSHPLQAPSSTRKSLGPAKHINANVPIAKTPGGTKSARRRAFGDISNRKAARSGGNLGFGGGATKSVSFPTPGRQSSAPKSAKKPGIGASTQRTPFGDRSNGNGNGNGNGTSTASKRGQMKRMEVPTNQRATQKKKVVIPKRTSVIVAPAQNVIQHEGAQREWDDDDDLSDVELPAGRVWDPSDYFDDPHSTAALDDSLLKFCSAFKESKSMSQSRRKAYMKAEHNRMVEADSLLVQDLETLALDDYQAVMGGMEDLLEGIDCGECLALDDSTMSHFSITERGRQRPGDGDFLFL